MPTDTQPIKDAARAYLDRGYRVIPLHRAKGKYCSCKKGGNCDTPGKHPLEYKWQEAAKVSGADVESHWGMAPVRNLGIVTGPESGLLVVDVDPKSGGNDTMAALTAEHGNDWIRTYTVKTGSGGWHFYFSYPVGDADFGNSAGKIGPGIDTRGKGGFVVAAPSRSGAGEYVVHSEAPLRAAPPWLLDMLRPKERERTTEAPKDLSAIPEAELRRLNGYVDGAIAREVGKLRALHHDGTMETYRGEPWDITTHTVACNLLELANAPWSYLTEGAAESLVLDNAPRDPGFDTARVQAKIDSAHQTVGDHEALYPEKPTDWLNEDASSDTDDLMKPSASGPGSEAGDDWGGTNAAPPPEKITIAQAIAGIPVVKGTLVPDYAERYSAASLGSTYRAKDVLEVEPYDVDSVDVTEVLRPLHIDESLEDDLEPFEQWIDRNLRSSTPERLWAALGNLLEGRDPEAPVIVLRGGQPLLALLLRLIRPEVGDDTETVHAGGRLSTREHPGDQVVFEIADEPIDLWPMHQAIVAKALASAEKIAPEDATHHDQLDHVEDYRAAQLQRARLGLGSRRRNEEDI